MNTDELVEKMRQVLGDALAKQMGIGYYYVTAETARAALAVVPMTEWQPIETAPKDGSSILFSAAGWKRAWAGYYLSLKTAQFAGDVERFGEGWKRDNYCDVQCNPTHWQPLPAPPERAGK